MNEYLNKIICGDCLEVMKQLPDKCVDLVLTDPPYRVISGGAEDFGGFRSGIALDKENKGRIFEHNDIEISEWLPEVSRVMKDGSHGYCFTNQMNLRDFLNEFERNQLYVHRVLVWNKEIATWTRFYMKTYEPIIFFKKGNAKAIKEQGTKDILNFPNPKEKVHPTEKSSPLCEVLISNSSEIGDIVLDPFLGSGTTAVACKQLKRNFIGIEISPKYCEIAQKRLDAQAEPMF